MKKTLFVFLTFLAMYGYADTNSAISKYQSKSYKTVLPEFQLLASTGDRVAQAYLGVMYEFGQGVTKSNTQAAKWYRLSAEQGDAFAQVRLGIICENGLGVTKDRSEAAKWYRLAADQGNSYGQSQLAAIYLFPPDGIAQDYAEARKLFTLAASQGHPAARTLLANMYILGQGGVQSYTVAYALSICCNGEINNSANPPFYLKSMSHSEILASQALAKDMSMPGNFINALNQYLANSALTKSG